MVRVTVEHGVHGAVDMQQHAILAAPIGQAGVSRQTAGKVVMHNDRCADFLGKLGTLVHHFRRWSRYVQVVPFALSGLAFSFQCCVLNKLKTIAPTHERLAINVFIVLGEVQAAAQAFVNGTTVILGRQTQLGFNGATQQWTAIFVHLVALDLNTLRRASTGFYISNWEADIFQTQGTQRFKSKHIPYQGSQHVNYRAFFKQINRIGNKGKETGIVTRNVFYAISATLVVIQIGQ